MSTSFATNLQSLPSPTPTSSNPDAPAVVSTLVVAENPPSMNDTIREPSNGQSQQETQEEDLPLPTHIERKVNPDGRVYYVNHETRKTSWAHPLNQTDSDHIERKVDAKGRSYYADHECKKTGWLNPTMIDKAKAIEDPELRKRREWTAELTKVYTVDYSKNVISEPETYDGHLPKEGAWVE